MAGQPSRKRAKKSEVERLSRDDKETVDTGTSRRAEQTSKPYEVGVRIRNGRGRRESEIMGGHINLDANSSSELPAWTGMPQQG